MKVYTKAEYNRLKEETLFYRQLKSGSSGFDIVRADKSQWSERQYHFVNFSSGIELELVDERILLDRNLLNRHDNSQCFVAKFYLSGYQNVICPGIDGIAAEYTETRGQNYLFYLPDIEEIEQFVTGDRWRVLVIDIDLNNIKRFFTELNTFPQQLQRLIEGKNPQRFHFNVGSITYKMETIIQEIWQHPYQGAIARMYLEGKVLELLALQLAQLTGLKLDTVRTTLKPRTIDRIYQAREILATSLENPPSILELTKQVGLCDRTLRRGFRELFGTTAIGYVNQKRMEKAELLLREKKLSVTEVADLLGYSHLGHFSAAFKRQFGINPSQCCQEKRPFEI